MNKSDERENRDIEALIDDEELIEQALARGTRAALHRHKWAGVPIVVWEDGRIKWIPAEQIQVTEPPGSVA